MPRRFLLCARLSAHPTLVGYNKGGTEAGNNIYRIASFVGVNSAEGTTFTLSQISFDWDFAYYNPDYIATIDDAGSQDEYFTYDPDEGHWYQCDEDFNVDYDTIRDDKELEINKGVIIHTESGEDLTYSGQVLAGDTELFGAAGENTYTGNFTPATLKLGDLVVSGDIAYYNPDYIATIDDAGSQDKYYTYDPDMSSWFECDEDFNVDYEAPANEVEIEPNMGLIFHTEGGGSITIPSPIK